LLLEMWLSFGTEDDHHLRKLYDRTTDTREEFLNECKGDKKIQGTCVEEIKQKDSKTGTISKLLPNIMDISMLIFMGVCVFMVILGVIFVCLCSIKWRRGTSDVENGQEESEISYSPLRRQE